MSIILGDCRKVMAEMPAGSVDMILADPPYGDTSLEWDRIVTGWSAEARRLLKPHGSMWVFGSLRFFLDPRNDFAAEGWKLAQEIVWEKHNGSGFHADRFRRIHELAVHFYPADAPWSGVYKEVQYTADAVARTVNRKKGRPAHTGRINAVPYQSVDGGPRMMRSVIYARSCHGSAEHPTQKPVEILEPLIRFSCPPGGIVLDPFAGSGSTGVAASSCGRLALMIEAREEYHAIAVRRNQAEDMFG